MRANHTKTRRRGLLGLLGSLTLLIVVVVAAMLATPAQPGGSAIRPPLQEPSNVRWLSWLTERFLALI